MSNEANNDTRREPFLTCSKVALDAIVSRIDGTLAAYCIAVYVALRWLQNDANGGRGGVEVTIALVAYRARVSYKTAARALDALESIGLIAVVRRAIVGTKAKAPSFYTFPLLCATLPATDRTLGTGEGTLGTEGPPFRAERYKESKDKNILI